MHPLATDKGSIASKAVMDLVRIPDSIPSKTFSNGAYPHTYTTLSFGENPEPDTQSLQPNLSPLEFAGLANMQHVIPRSNAKRMSMPTTWATGMDARVMGRVKWKTSYAVSPTDAPYQSPHKTSTNLPITRIGKSNWAKNRGILAQSMAENVFTQHQTIQNASDREKRRQAAETTVFNRGMYDLAARAAGMSWADKSSWPKNIATLASSKEGAMLRDHTGWATMGHDVMRNGGLGWVADAVYHGITGESRAATDRRIVENQKKRRTPDAPTVTNKKRNMGGFYRA